MDAGITENSESGNEVAMYAGDVENRSVFQSFLYEYP